MTSAVPPTFLKALLASSLIHAVLIAYGTYQDATSAVKYTDVDYKVFTDAARLMWTGSEGASEGWLGGNWLGRSTYRYTPLLAVLMLPNHLVHPIFGKLLFSGCDLLVGYLLYLLSTPSTPTSSKQPSSCLTAWSSIDQPTWWISLLWLFNPLPLNISTRGSSESLLGALTLTSLYLFRHLSRPPTPSTSLTKAEVWASVVLGVAVHLKIYPVIYAVAVLGHIGRGRPTRLGRLGVCRKGVEFGLVSGGSFALLTGGCWLIWGFPAVFHPYLYHLTRLDHRHNFSPYFYPIYLLSSTASSSLGPSTNMLRSLLRSSLASFLPQLALSVGLSGWLGAKGELVLAWGLGTMAFVNFNKVITSQYFIWYLSFMPLILPRINVSKRKAIGMGFGWVVAQAAWLYPAFNVEFLGKPWFLALWLSSLLFVWINSWILGELILRYR